MVSCSADQYLVCFLVFMFQVSQQFSEGSDDWNHFHLSVVVEHHSPFSNTNFRDKANLDKWGFEHVGQRSDFEFPLKFKFLTVFRFSVMCK